MCRFACRLLPRVVWVGLLVQGLSVASTVSAAERVELREGPVDPRVYKVAVHLDAVGKLLVAAGEGKSTSLKLSVDGRSSYVERRLPGLGRDAEALHSLRHYDSAQAEIRVDEHVSFQRLRDSLRLVVARGKREGVELFSPSGPFTFNELELLETPADSLTMLALLPEQPVEPGDTWKPADWALQLISQLEAVEKVALTCKFDSRQGDVARVTFTGEISGANLGATTRRKVDGHYLFDLKAKHIKRLEFTQTETSAIGAVAPGLDVLAKVVIDRSLSEQPDRLRDDLLEKLPLEPNEASLLLAFEAPEWNVRFYHDRGWHLYQQTSRVAVLRLMDKGTIVAQCNINLLPNAPAGSHVPEQQFQTDIERSLGKNFQKILQAEKVQSQDGRFIYRVTALGETPRTALQWIYYLVAHPDGRQLVMVFTLEPKLAETLQSRDLSMVSSLEFLAPKSAPQLAPQLTPPQPAPQR